MYLIPAPAKLEKKEGRFIWAYDRYVTVDQSCSQLVTRQASLFCDCLLYTSPSPRDA